MFSFGGFESIRSKKDDEELADDKLTGGKNIIKVKKGFFDKPGQGTLSRKGVSHYGSNEEFAAFTPLSGGPQEEIKKDKTQTTKSTPKPAPKSAPTKKEPKLSTLSKDELLTLIKENTRKRFNNDEVYQEAQKLPFYYAVMKEASLEELIAAGMRDTKDDAVFKSLMLNLKAETGRDAIHSAQLERLHTEWHKATTPPKPEKTAKASGAGHFAVPAQKPTGNSDFNDLFAELTLRL